MLQCEVRGKRWILHVVHFLKWRKRSSSITLSQKSSASFISRSSASSSSSKHGICSMCAWVSFWNSSWAFSLSSTFLAGSEKRGGRQQDAYILHKSEVVLRPSLDKVRAVRTERRTWNPGSVVIAWRQTISAPSSSSPEHTTIYHNDHPPKAWHPCKLSQTWSLGFGWASKDLRLLVDDRCGVFRASPTKNRINGKVTKLGKNLPGAKKCPKHQMRFCPGHPCHNFIGESTLRKALYRHQRNQRLYAWASHWDNNSRSYVVHPGDWVAAEASVCKQRWPHVAFG